MNFRRFGNDGEDREDVVVRRGREVDPMEEAVSRRSTPAPRKERKKRDLGPRKSRTFNYRGQMFLVENEGNYSHIYTKAGSDPKSGFAYQATVEQDKMILGVRELVKIANAEEALSKLAIKK